MNMDPTLLEDPGATTATTTQSHDWMAERFKMEVKERELRKALGDLVDAVNAEFPGGMSHIGGKTGAALIQAVDALATKPDVAAILEAQKNNHKKPLQLD